MALYFRLAEISLFASLFTHRESLLFLAGFCLLLWACRQVHSWREAI